MLRQPMKNLTRSSMFAAAAFAALWIPLSGRTTDTPIDLAALAWDKGDYVVALNAYLRILDGPDGDAAFETIALQTGELFHTTELTNDGDVPKFSPDGQYVVYETGPLAARLIRLARTSAPTTPTAELTGSRAVFSPDSARFAYLKLAPSAEVQQAQAALDAAPQAERAQRTAALNTLIGVQSRVVIRDVASGRETELDTARMRKTGIAFLADGGAAGTGVFISASPADGGPAQIYGRSRPATLRKPSASRTRPARL
jgi:hypothetical protein